MINKTLWTRNFKLMVLSCVIGAIVGEATMLPISYSAYEQTQSPLLSMMVTVVSFAPDVFVSIFAGTLIDRSNKKNVVLWLNTAFAFAFLAAGIYLNTYSFNYNMLLLFTFIISVISAFENLAFMSVFPELITKGMESKAFSVTNMIYPLMTIVLAPLSSYIYKVIGLGNMMYIAFVLTIIGNINIALIQYERPEYSKSTNKFIDDFKSGINYLKNDPALMKLYLFLAVYGAIGIPSSEIMRMLFQSTPGLGVVLYGVASSVEMVSRVIFGSLYYKKGLQKNKRIKISAAVHLLYAPTTLIAFMLGYPVYLVQGFVMRGLGQITYTMRSACVAKYLKPEMKGRAYSVSTLLTSLISIPVTILVGFIAEGMPLMHMLVAVTILETMVVYFMFVKNMKLFNPIYMMDIDVNDENNNEME